MPIKSILPYLCLLSLIFLRCTSDEDIVILDYNVDCLSDCLVIHGSISPLPNSATETLNSRLTLSFHDNGFDNEIAYTRIAGSAENYSISVPIEEVLKDLNLSLENGENVDEVSYSLTAANGKSESIIVYDSFSTLDISLLTYAERELTLKVNYRLNGQPREKSQAITLPALQDTSLAITLD